MPVDLPEPPYAYVVDVRALDQCVVPNCTITGRRATGYADKIELDGDIGAYVRHGKVDNELFFRRARTLRKGESLAFDVPASTAASELDFYVSSVATGHYKVRLRITSQSKAEPAQQVLDRTIEGDTAAFVPRTKTEEVGKIEQFSQHVRLPLPSRADKVLHVTFENLEDGIAAVENPLVMKRVDGRGPRQGFMFVLDATPFFLLERLFTGTGDGPTEFLRKATAERGIFFPKGFSPAVSTQLFGRRFFRNGYFANDGEPLLRGAGLDEDPPDRIPTPVARLAENGFRTEQFVANFMVQPDASVIGFDGGYENAVITYEYPNLFHPISIAMRFDAWLAEHSHDDTWAVFWIQTTHDSLRLPKMWTPERRQVFAPMPPTITSKSEYRAEECEARWENMLDVGANIGKMFASAAKYSPQASRLWFITADHGLIESMANANRPARYAEQLVTGSPQHRFFGATEEVRTPFALIYDGVARPPRGPAVVEERTMSAATWRAVEQLFSVDVGAPETSSFDSAFLSPTAYSTRWKDDCAFSVAHALGFRCAADKWGYRTHQPKLWLNAIWDQSDAVQQMLGGADRRSGRFISEELYDDEADPLETKNIAAANPEIVMSMRRRTADMIASYDDAPSHPRYRHTLTFPTTLDLFVEGPRPFKLKADGVDVAMTSPRQATVRAKKLEVIEDKESMGLVAIKGAPGTLLLRCASSGQPLDEIGPDRDRFNLAVARHNCIEPRKKESNPPPGEVWFSADLLRSKAAGTSANGTNEEILEGLKRWGYVRDMDKDKH